MPYKRKKWKYRNAKKKRHLTQQEKVQRSKVYLVIIPIIIVLVLAAGIFFGYLAYTKNNEDIKGIKPVNTSENTNGNILENQNNILSVTNGNHLLEESYVPDLVDVDNVKVNKVIEEDLKKLINAAKSDGINLEIEKGYTSFSDQQKSYEEKKQGLIESKGYTDIKAEAETKKTVPIGGASEYQTGLLVKFKSENSEKDFANSKESVWLERNGVNYGFILRYPENHVEDTTMNYDSTLYRYVGHENALKIRSYGMCLDEYVNHIGVQ